MHRDEAPALQGTALGAALHFLNPVMRSVLRSPLHPILDRWFLLLRWVGPRTGQPHEIPVSYVQERGHIYATTGDGWWRNVVRAPKVHVTLRGSSQSAHLVPIEESGQSVAEHELLFRRHPFFRRFAGIPASHGNPDPAAVRRSVDAGRTLLRIDVSSQPDAASAGRGRLPGPPPPSQDQISSNDDSPDLRAVNTAQYRQTPSRARHNSQQ